MASWGSNFIKNPLKTVYNTGRDIVQDPWKELVNDSFREIMAGGEATQDLFIKGTGGTTPDELKEEGAEVIDANKNAEIQAAADEKKKEEDAFNVANARRMAGATSYAGSTLGFDKSDVTARRTLLGY